MGVFNSGKGKKRKLMDEMTEQNVIWDLTDLYPSDLIKFNADLNGIVDRCMTLQSNWKGKLETINEAQWSQLMREFESVVEVLTRLGSYVQLSWTVNSTDYEIGRRMQNVREISAMASQYLMFMSLEVGGLSEPAMNTLKTTDLYRAKSQWFDSVREAHKFSLNEQAEYVMATKQLTARSAWVRMSDQTSAAQLFEFRGETLTSSELIKQQQNSDREIRKEAAKVFTRGLVLGVQQQAFVFNTVLADHAANDRLRGYTNWVASRNQSNHVSDEAVQALVDAVVGRYDVVTRFYELKKRLLGYDTLYTYDRSAPISGDKEQFTWEESKQLVLDSYNGFDTRMGTIVSRFFDDNWIHAPVAKGKNSGAYSAGTSSDVHPYIFLNFAGSARDVRTLAHELGHGVHQFLSRQHGPLLSHTPLTVAETASVFGEMITFNNIFTATTSVKGQLALVMQKLDDMLATVYRQISFNRFEDAIHTHRRTKGELSIEHFNEHWMKSQRDLYGTSVELSDDYSTWWSYISHFIHTPGYVYAYAFGELLVLALYDVYKQDPDGFKEKYITLLSSGGSKKPEDLLAPFGLDILDPNFWHIGISVIERYLDKAEELADLLVAETA